MDTTALPDLVPVRMLNEFAYCPRLCHLEWVQSRFAHNDDTWEGRYAHRRTDRGGGAVPPPGEAPVAGARAVALSSPDLGLAAVLDLVEQDGDGVAPVEAKKGRPPDTPERSWEPERIQLCAQGLLLRDAGYSCDHGYLSFAETRERVRIDFDGPLVDRTLALLAALRAMVARDGAPAPLTDSRKCPRCSLVGLCLPDEVNALADRQGLPLRRIMPRDPENRPLYVTEAGSFVGVDGSCLVVKRAKEVVATVRLIDVSQLCLVGGVQVSSQALARLMGRGTPVCWFSHGGWFTGMATGLPAKDVELRRRQYAAGEERCLEVARAMVAAKIRNSRTVLRRNARVAQPDAVERLRAAALEAGSAGSAASLLGVEGAAARTYFGAWLALVRPDLAMPGAPFAWDGRTRRPPLDALNCLLSYVYSLLTKDLTVVAHTVGLDPYLGLYHRPRFGRPALALDVAEEFRPIVADSVVLTCVNNGEVRPEHFTVRAGGVGLTKEGRHAVISGYERRLDAQVKHPVFGYRLSYRRVLDVQVRMLAAFLLGEVPAYVPFVTR